MKKTILLAMIWVAAMACDKKEEATPEAEIKTAIVPYRQATTVAISGVDLKVDLRELTDSRCPKDVICVQMGSAQIKFSVTDGSSSADVDVTFSGDGKNSGIKAFSLNGKNYELKVSEVNPYPISSVAPKLEDYKVNVTIETK
ncbi:hypothetical protein [Dyadobacter bucti]|uniref:hypothetical protein n=1 Tax=Dyadobacter bucti TaxID=2572203 RepID=UPI001109C767|nr:hypothetical protein [Dyadobacter bucti]